MHKPHTSLAVRVQALALSPADLYLSTLSTDVSRDSMRGALNAVVNVLGVGRVEETTVNGRHRNVTYRSFPWQELRVEHVTVIRSALIEAGYAPISASKMLAGVKGVMGQCRVLKLISRDDLADIGDIPGVPGRPLPAGAKRALSEAEFLRIIDAGASEGAAQRARNDAILWLQYLTGMRRGEFVACRKATGWQGLTLDRWDARARTLHLVGKGGVERKAPVEGHAYEALCDWLTHRRQWRGALFTRVRQNDSVTREPLGGAGIYLMLKERAANAMPPVEDVTPHTLRRTTVTDLELRGVPEAVIQRLVGHQRADTTRRYFYPPEHVFSDAVKLRDVQR